MNRRPWIKILEEFYATVLTKDGEDYKLDGFHVMVTAVDLQPIPNRERIQTLNYSRRGYKSLKRILDEKARHFCVYIITSNRMIIIFLIDYKFHPPYRLIRLTFEKFMRADLSQIALKIMSLPIQISLIQLIPGSVRFCEFRKAAFHDTTLYVSLHVRRRQISFFDQCGPTSVCFCGKF